MMSNNLLGFIIGFISLVALGLIINSTRLPSESSTTSQTNPSNSAQPETLQDKNKLLTKEEIAKHNNEDDCWTIIDGNVYDITSYVPRHPGGDEILRACGADGSSLFNSRKTESGEEVGSGTSHSSSAKSTLSRFQVGTVSN